MMFDGLQCPQFEFYPYIFNMHKCDLLLLYKKQLSFKMIELHNCMKSVAITDCLPPLLFSSLLFTDIVHCCVDSIVTYHFNAFSHLLRAAKDPIEDFLDEQFQKAEEKIHSQFKMERIVYSQDALYSNKLDDVKQKPSKYGSLFASADIREMTYHLTSYLTVCLPHQ